MARHETTFTVTDDNRDRGKVFHIREMSARAAEKWASRALMAAVRAGADIPDEIAGAGMAGVAAMGIRAFLGMRWDDAEPLLDEMMTCVQIVTDPGRSPFRRDVTDDDIDEVKTLLRLREEVLSLHVGFSLAELRLKLTSSSRTDDSSQNTGISPPASA
jgi:hypothetical protein